MRYCDRKALRDVLKGDAKRLSVAFLWTETPQGRGYWYKRANGLELLDVRDFAYVAMLLEETR